MIWSLVELLSLLSVPLLLGVLAYFQVRKLNKVLAHLVGFLISPAIFFFLAQAMLFSSIRAKEAHGASVCGTFIGMMSLMLLFGTGVEMCLSLIAQLVLVLFALHPWHRTSISEFGS